MYFEKNWSKGSKMTQWVNVLAADLDAWGSVPRTHGCPVSITHAHKIRVIGFCYFLVVLFSRDTKQLKIVGTQWLGPCSLANTWF